MRWIPENRIHVSGAEHGREVAARTGRAPKPARKIPVERRTDAFCGVWSFHPSNEDLLLGTPDSFHPIDEDLSLGAPGFGEDGRGPVESIFP